MKVTGSHALEARPERIFRVVMDPVALGRCIPGCRELQEVEPNSVYTYDLTYGYRGSAHLKQVDSSSCLGRWAIGISGTISKGLKTFDPHLLKAFRNAVCLALRILKNRFPSTLLDLKSELVIEGTGSAGSIKGIVDFEVEVGRSQTLVKYQGDVYLGGPAALLASWSPAAGGLNPGELLRSFFNNLEDEVTKTNPSADGKRAVLTEAPRRSPDTGHQP